MPNRAQWEPDYAVGHEVVDAQHRGLLAQCNLLADHCEGTGGEDGERRFDEAFERLKALAREHFETESALHAACGDPDLEDQQFEYEEFEYLAGEVATTGNFDRLEVQRFLTLWCIGHIAGSAARLRAVLAGGEASE